MTASALQNLASMLRCSAQVKRRRAQPAGWLQHSLAAAAELEVARQADVAERALLPRGARRVAGGRARQAHARQHAGVEGHRGVGGAPVVGEGLDLAAACAVGACRSNRGSRGRREKSSDGRRWQQATAGTSSSRLLWELAEQAGQAGRRQAGAPSGQGRQAPPSRLKVPSLHSTQSSRLVVGWLPGAHAAMVTGRGSGGSTPMGSSLPLGPLVPSKLICTHTHTTTHTHLGGGSIRPDLGTGHSLSSSKTARQRAWPGMAYCSARHVVRNSHQRQPASHPTCRS